MIKTIIFDNNGVLTTCDDDTTVPRFAEYFDVDVEYLRPIFHQVVSPADSGDITTDEFFQNIARALGKDYKSEDIWPIFLTCYQSKPEMKSLLIELKKEYQIALLTNFTDSFDKINSNHWHYEDIFDKDKIFVSSKIHLIKPDPNFYIYALDGLGSRPEETVFIDDREENLVPARNLGMKTVLFTSPKQCQNELQLLLGVENV